MKDLLISHTDLDGISCNLLLDLAKKKYDYFNVEISELSSTIDEILKSDCDRYENIYFTDLTLSQEDYQKLERAHINFKVFDHHATHLYAVNYPNTTIKVDEFGHKTCGTELFYNYLKTIYLELDTPLIASYVELVRQIDTYTMESDEPRNLSTLLAIYGKKEFLHKMKIRLKKDKETFTFSDFEKRYLKIKNAEFDLYYTIKEKDLMIYEINKQKCGIIFCGNTDKSELGHRLSRNHPELDLIILIDTSKSISYRTEREDVDVSEFAKIFGGGGHVKASGSNFSDENRDEIIKSYFKDVKRLENETN